MDRSPSRRGRTGSRITLARASRLRRFLLLLSQKPLSRNEILRDLGVGLRTFYRELDYLRRQGIRVRTDNRLYRLSMTFESAEGRLPFPDPQLSFREAAELSLNPGDAARRLAELLDRLTKTASPPRRGRSGSRRPEVPRFPD
jgi:predicted DNA-binding transcriptional regulator YafY